MGYAGSNEYVSGDTITGLTPLTVSLEVQDAAADPNTGTCEFEVSLLDETVRLR